MLDTLVLCFVAWTVLAAASFRHRRQAGIVSPHAIAGLRLAGAALLIAALFHCGTDLDGERWVRFLGGASLAGATVVALLSVAPAATMRPVALIVRRLERPDHPRTPRRDGG